MADRAGPGHNPFTRDLAQSGALHLPDGILNSDVLPTSQKEANVVREFRGATCSWWERIAGHGSWKWRGWAGDTRAAHGDGNGEFRRDDDREDAASLVPYFILCIADLLLLTL